MEPKQVPEALVKEQREKRIMRLKLLMGNPLCQFSRLRCHRVTLILQHRLAGSRSYLIIWMDFDQPRIKSA